MPSATSSIRVPVCEFVCMNGLSGAVAARGFPDAVRPPGWYTEAGRDVGHGGGPAHPIFIGHGTPLAPVTRRPGPGGTFMHGPSPADPHPMTGFPQVGFLKPLVKNPLIRVG